MHYRVERQLIGGGIHVFETEFTSLEQIRITFNLINTPQVGELFSASCFGQVHTFRVTTWGKNS